MLHDSVKAQQLAPRCLRGFYFEAKCVPPNQATSLTSPIHNFGFLLVVLRCSLVGLLHLLLPLPLCHCLLGFLDMFLLLAALQARLLAGVAKHSSRSFIAARRSKYHEFIQNWHDPVKIKLDLDGSRCPPAMPASGSDSLAQYFRNEDDPHHQEMMERAELVQKILHDAIMMEELDEDPEIFSDGTVYSDLDHGNDRCF
jgi:hypothetical protein